MLRRALLDLTADPGHTVEREGNLAINQL